jgi:molecular chaperone HscB
MQLDSDDFELFGIPRQYALDRAALDARWRALQWAVRVNEAYQRLKDPLKRAAYLCELAGVRVDAENNTAMPAAFLMQQMEWREALDDAAGVEQVHTLADAVSTHRGDALKRLQSTLDEAHDAAAAAQQVRALMFVERFASDLDQRLEALGQ